MSDRQAALETALRQIEKQFGKGSIMKLGENVASLNVEVISSGSLALDIALGVGGYPRGRVKQPLHYMLLLKFKNKVELLHLSMQSMH